MRKLETHQIEEAYTLQIVEDQARLVRETLDKTAKMLAPVVEAAPAVTLDTLSAEAAQAGAIDQSTGEAYMSVVADLTVDGAPVTIAQQDTLFVLTVGEGDAAYDLTFTGSGLRSLSTLRTSTGQALTKEAVAVRGIQQGTFTVNNQPRQILMTGLMAEGGSGYAQEGVMIDEQGQPVDVVVKSIKADFLKSHGKEGPVEKEDLVHTAAENAGLPVVKNYGVIDFGDGRRGLVQARAKGKPLARFFPGELTRAHRQAVLDAYDKFQDDERGIFFLHMDGHANNIFADPDTPAAEPGFH
jgi:hypothetical protein